MIALTLAGERLELRFPYDAAIIVALRAMPGRRWDPFRRVWSVPMGAAHQVVELIHRYGGDVEAAEAIVATRTQAIEASRATDAAIEVPCPEGLAYLPFQRAGIAWAMAHPACLIADEMGLGKTIEALGAINADASIASILIICPASLKGNWLREAMRWIVRPIEKGIADTRSAPSSGIVIAQYDLFSRASPVADALAGRPWDLLILDECHYLKNHKAGRTRRILGERGNPGGIHARRVLALTGTPILNRPIELWPIVHRLAPGEFHTWYEFASRYAAAYQDKYGWQVGGASNLDELQERLRSSIMIRRLKVDVLPELPAKRRQIIEIDANGAAKTLEREQAAWAAQDLRLTALKDRAREAQQEGEDAYRAAVKALRAGRLVAFSEMSKVRHDTALAKLPHVIEHLRDALESGGKVVCYAHHHDVVNALATEFGEAAVVLTGDTPVEQRQGIVDRFQSDESIRLFLGSITAAGVGITLTAASHVVFSELDWVPANITQAEDRCHRIGQAESVLVQHLVFAESLDARMAKKLVKKQAIMDQALDDKTLIEQGFSDDPGDEES